LDTSETDSKAEATAAYERWENNWWFRPFRSAFWGLAIFGIAGAILLEENWNTHFRWLGVGLGLMFVFGLLRLFYDIPQRRLSRISRAFLTFGIAVPLVLALAAVINTWVST
jgi:hypothetical protein